MAGFLYSFCVEGEQGGRKLKKPTGGGDAELQSRIARLDVLQELRKRVSLPAPHPLPGPMEEPEPEEH